MVKFEIASGITRVNEGGLADNHSDNGGFTYAGISEKFWPNWPGWSLVHNIIKLNDKISSVNGDLRQNQQLQSLVQSFYKQNFWDTNKLDQINDQQLANSVYDFGVNSGVTQAAKTLQDVAGVKVDGIIGQQTITAVNALNAETLYNEYNYARSVFYHGISLKPGQAQFLKSWLSRLKPYQK